jgi:hypothetical protein
MPNAVAFARATALLAPYSRVIGARSNALGGCHMYKSTKITAFLFTTFLVAVSHGNAFATSCDPNAILRSNVSQYNENLAVWLSYVKDLQRTTDSKDSSSVGLSYAGFGLDFADANSLYQYVSDHENYSLTATDSISVLRSTLDQGSVNAYLACIHSNNPITVQIPDTATTDITFPVTVHWNPDYPAPDNQILTMTVINGTIDGKQKITAKMKNKSDEQSFQVLRDNNGGQKLYVTASIFGKVSDPATIPPIPKFKLGLSAKFSPQNDKPALSICRSGQCGTTYVKLTQCIYPDSGSILIPSTLKFVAEKLVGDPRRSGFSVEPGADQFHACGSIFSSAGGNEDYNLISGRFMAAQTILTPIDPTATTVAPKQAKMPNAMENWDSFVKDNSAVK